MSEQNFFTESAVKLERSAAILNAISALLALASVIVLIVGLYQYLATDEYQPRLIAGAIVGLVALIPFVIAQIFLMRSHLLRVAAALNSTP